MERERPKCELLWIFEFAHLFWSLLSHTHTHRGSFALEPLCPTSSPCTCYSLSPLHASTTGLEWPLNPTRPSALFPKPLWCLLIVLWTLTPVLQSANKDHVVSPQPHLSLIPALRFAPGGCPPKKVCLWESLFVSRYVVNSTGSGSSEHVQMQSTPASSRTSHQGEVSYSRPSPARHPPLSAAGLPTGGWGRAELSLLLSSPSIRADSGRQ